MCPVCSQWAVIRIYSFPFLSEHSLAGHFQLIKPGVFVSARASSLLLSSEQQRWSEIESALFIILVKRQQKRLRPFSQVIAKTSPSAVPLHDIHIFNALKWCFFVPKNFDKWSDWNAHRQGRSNQRSKSNWLPISLQWLDLERDGDTGEVSAGETGICSGFRFTSSYEAVVFFFPKMKSQRTKFYGKWDFKGLIKVWIPVWYCELLMSPTCFKNSTLINWKLNTAYP